MDMSSVLIYEDDKKKIEMTKSVADWLWLKKATRYKLKSEECEVVLNEAVHLASCNQPIKQKIITTLEIPVFSKDVPLLSLREPYNVFEDAILLIGDAFGCAESPLTDHWRYRLATLVTDYYSLQGMGRLLCTFFPEPICKVDGFLWYYNDDSNSGPIYLPFIINDGKFKRIYE